MRNVIWPALLAGGLLLPGCAREPQSGEYHFERVGEVRGDCNLGDRMKDFDMDATTTINVSPGGKSMTVSHQGKDTNCTLDGNNFECTFMDDVEESKDASIRRTLKADGTWTSDRMLEGTINYAAACTGVDCVEKETAGDQFCNAELDVTGRLSSPGTSMGGESENPANRRPSVHPGGPMGGRHARGGSHMGKACKPKAGEGKAGEGKFGEGKAGAKGGQAEGHVGSAKPTH